jgi:probable addiction module antidote protein
MRLKNYKADLLKRLENPHCAAEYLAQVLAEKDNAAFLIALKDVVEAGGGVGNLAGRVGLKRPSLYKILSKNGNPTLETLQEILGPLGLRVSVALDKAA